MPRRRRILVLLNPHAGRGELGGATPQQFSDDAGLDAEIIVPDPDDHAVQMAQAHRELAEGVDAVLVRGGDGMVAAGVNLVAQTDVPLGVIPAGTGNDFARAAQLPLSPPAALQHLLTALRAPELTTVAVDALHVTLRAPGVTREWWVANSLNIGFDAEVNQRAETLRHIPGSLRYLVGLVQSLPGFHTRRMRLQLDDVVHELDAALICVHNGGYIGGGIPLNTQAKHDDGVLNVSTVGRVSRTGVTLLFPLVYLGAHRLLRPLSAHQATRLRIHIPAGVPVYADGEAVLAPPLGTPSATEDAGHHELQVQVVPGAVRLIHSETVRHTQTW